VEWRIERCCFQSLSFLTFLAIRPEGKNNRLFVFSISMASVAHWSLDVAADSQEELQDWVKKIREVAQTADARVRTCGSLECCWGLSGLHVRLLDGQGHQLLSTGGPTTLLAIPWPCLRSET
jgi:hypothetical protein